MTQPPLTALPARHATQLTGILLIALLSACAAPPRRCAPQTPQATSELARASVAGVDVSALRCESHTTWISTLSSDAKAAARSGVTALAAAGISLPESKRAQAQKALKSVAMWALVRNTLLGGSHHNAGAIVLKNQQTRAGRPLVVFRSGLTANPERPSSCVGSLLRAGGVRHVINLYAGPMRTADLETAEERATTRAGGSYFSVRKANDAELRTWRDRLRDDGDATRELIAMKAIARIVREQVLRPHGQAPVGNVLVHCGGGMHRTGIVIGVMDRCLNHSSMSQIEADYKRHVAWKSDASPGGFEAENLRFISRFDCALLQPAGSK